MPADTEWLRVRGMGRERFAGHLADYLETLGYSVERSESGEPAFSWVAAHLLKRNPAVPEGAKELKFRLFPTSGGAAIAWVEPVSVPEADRPRLERLVREIMLHLERTVLTESHATAKVSKAPDVRLPWQGAPPSTGAPS